MCTRLLNKIRRPFLILLITASQFTLFGQSSNSVELSNKVISNGCGGDFQQIFNYSGALNNNLTADQLQQLKNSITNFDDMESKNYAAAIAQYQKLKTDANVAKAIFEGNKVLWGFIGDKVKDISNADPEIESQAIIKSTAIISTKLTEYSMDYLKEKADENRRNALDGILYNLRQNNQQGIDSLRNNPNMDDETFINILFRSNAENEKMYNSLENSDKPTFLKYMQDDLKNAVKEQSFDDLGRSNAISQKLEDYKDTLINIANQLQDNLEQTNSTVHSLAASQLTINENLETLTNRVDLNTNDVSFIKDYLYGKMDPVDKLKAVDQGWLKTLPPDQLEKETEKLKLLNAQKEFFDNSKKYLTQAQDVLNIAHNIGLKIPTEVSDGVNILNTGLSALTQFSGGDILGGLSTISGLFGKKTDPVMEKLGAMDKKLDWMMKTQNELVQQQYEMGRQLDDVLTGIGQLLKDEELIYNSVNSLSIKADSQYYNLYKKLDSVDVDILYERNQIHYYESERPLNTIHSYIVNNPGLNINVANDSFPDYNKIVPYLNGWKSSQLKSWETTLFTTFAVTQNESGVFDLPDEFKVTEFIKNNSQDDINVKMISVMKLMDSLFYYYLSDVQDADQNKYYASLLMPFKKITDLSKKDGKITISDLSANGQIMEVINFLDHDMPFNSNNTTTNNFLEPSYLYEATNDLVNFYYFYSFLDRKFNALSVDDYINGKSMYSNPGKMLLLTKAQFLLNVAIAQQNLLSGDVLIPFIYRKLSKGLVYPPDSDTGYNARIQRMCLRALETNDLLRYNFINYYVAKRLEYLQRSPANYALGLNLGTPYYLQHVLMVQDNIDLSDNSYQQLKIHLMPDSNDPLGKKQIWSYNLPSKDGENLDYPLPCATSDASKLKMEELYGDDNIAYSSSMRNLINIKGYIDKVITEINLSKSLDNNQKSVLYKYIFLSNISK